MNDCAGLLQFAYDKVLLNDVKDVAFFRSRETRSYDALIATMTMCNGDKTTSATTCSVSRLQLATGQLEIIYGKH